MAKGQKTEKPEGAEMLKLDVTLLKKGATWKVLGSDGKPLLCRCGRPVTATLHNVSIPEIRTVCEKVVIKQ